MPRPPGLPPRVPVPQPLPVWDVCLVDAYTLVLPGDTLAPMPDKLPLP